MRSTPYQEFSLTRVAWTMIVAAVVALCLTAFLACGPPEPSTGKAELEVEEVATEAHEANDLAPVEEVVEEKEVEEEVDE